MFKITSKFSNWKNQSKFIFSLILLLFVISSLIIYRFKDQIFPYFYWKNNDVLDSGDELQVFMNKIISYINEPSLLEKNIEFDDKHNEHKAVELFINNLGEYKGEKPKPELLIQYFKNLHKLINAKISGYNAMANEELEEYVKQFKLNIDFAKDIDNARFYWLQLERDNYKIKRFPFVIWYNDKNKLCFNILWLKNSNKLVELADSYFNAIKNENKYLLTSYFAKKNENKDVVNAKVKLLLDYYRKYFAVSENWQNRFEAISLLGDNIQFRNELVKDYLNTSLNSDNKTIRYFRFYSLHLVSNELIIEDIIPTVIKDNQFSVYRNHNQVIALGQLIDVHTIYSTFGWWGDNIYVSDIPGDRVDGNGRALKKVRLVYPGISFEVQGTFIPVDNYIYGTVTDIKITDDKYYIADDVHCNMSITDLLLKYPYLDDKNFVLNTFDSKNLTFYFRDNKLREIKLHIDNEAQ